jgi:hypothetical protein
MVPFNDTGNLSDYHTIYRDVLWDVMSQVIHTWMQKHKTDEENTLEATQA